MPPTKLTQQQIDALQFAPANAALYSGTQAPPTSGTPIQIGASGMPVAPLFPNGLNQSQFDTAYRGSSSLDTIGTQSDPNLITIQPGYGATYGGNPNQLTYPAAIALLTTMHPDTLLTIQQEMYEAGLLSSENQVNGQYNQTTQDAWARIVSEAVRMSVPIGAVLNFAKTTGGFTKMQSTLENEITKYQTEMATPKTVSYTSTDPNALRDQLASAFTTTLGYGPTSAQVNQFVSSFHAAEQQAALATTIDPTTGMSYLSETTGAAAGLKRAQQELTALNGLGPDGIDAFLNAVRQVTLKNQAALGITNINQGPVTQLPSQGQIPMTQQYVPGQAAQAAVPGTTLPGTGGVTGPSVLAGARNVAVSGMDAVFPGLFAKTPMPSTTGPTVGGRPAVPATQGQEATVQNPLYMHGAQMAPGTNQRNQTVPYAGGVYGINPTAWSSTLNALGYTASRYPTPASAPESVQTAVATYYSEQQLRDFGDWGNVLSMLWTAKPLSASSNQPVFQMVNGHMTMQNFADAALTDVNNELNNMIGQVQSAGPPTVIAKPTPNAASDALAAARQSDPTGYIANESSDMFGIVNQMLYGAPSYTGAGAGGQTGGMAEASSGLPATATAMGG